MDTPIREEFKKLLVEERVRLTAALGDIASPDPKVRGNWNVTFPKFEEVESGASSSLEEGADEVEEYETRLGAEQSLESRLLAVSHALERIAKGTYGRCLTCGKEISLERLRANAAAAYDIEHEQ